VLVAFFGGLVGAIAVTRVEKGNPVPGVAIATALMPPLCTAGYGLAIGNFSYFFGAVYLYTINCFFICISTFLISKYLKYEPVNSLNTKYERKIRNIISTLIVLMILPSFYLAYSLFQEKTYTQKVEQFITKEFVDKGDVIIYKKLKFNSNPKKIELAFLTKKINAEDLKNINEKLIIYGLPNTYIEVIQDTKDLKNEILNELGNQGNVLMAKDITIDSLQNELKNYKTDERDILQEVSILFPELKNVSLGKHRVDVSTDSMRTITVLLYQTDIKVKIETSKIEKWLKHKLPTDSTILVKRQ
jgi:uncharacterized membrane protein